MAVSTKHALLESAGEALSLPSKAPASRAYGLTQALVWTGYALLNIALARAAGLNNRLIVAIFVSLSLLMFLSTHLMRALHRRRAHDIGLKRQCLHLIWLLPLSASAVQGALYLIVALLLLPLFGAPLASKEQAGAWFVYWFNTLVVLGLWSLAYLLMHQLQRARQAEIAFWQAQAQLHQAELQFLRSQINSHFLFNALNNLRALIRVDPELSRTRLTQLANLLRAILQSEQIDSISLREEIELAQAYLDMETLQYDQRLQVQWQIAPETESMRVPALALQTLLENAIKHGIACRARGGTIAVSAQMQASNLQITVSNPIAEHASTHTGRGIGLRNVRARLRHVFGDQATLNLSHEQEMVYARLQLPQALNSVPVAQV